MATAQQRANPTLGLSAGQSACLTGWLAFGVLINVVQVDLVIRFWVLAFLGYAVHALFGAVTFLLWTFAALADYRRGFGPGAAMLVAWVGLAFASPHLSRAGATLKFERERPAYERIVSWAQQSDWSPVGETGSSLGWAEGQTYRVDIGPPLRVAFEWTDGIGDWSGVVWDPTDLVAPAGDTLVRPEVRHLFGHTLLGCKRLRDHYYRCAFT